MPVWDSGWTGVNVVILGAARQGTALARYLVSQGASVTLSDVRPANELQTVQQALADLPLRWVLGDHPLELLDWADLICPSGGVPLEIPFIQQARERGIPLANDTEVFLEAVPCPVIGITGSAGKTTTTTLVGRMARAGVQQPQGSLSGANIWVGGNIGNSLITELDRIRPQDRVVLELSSFQLELVSHSPQVAAVLNITPNHLDRHGTMQAYSAAKARILAFQQPADTAVLGHSDPGAWGLRSQVQGRLISFGFSPPPMELDGTYLAEEKLMLQQQHNREVILSTGEVELPGRHNLLNILAASAIASAVGLQIEAMQAGILGFHGVPHRLEFVREWGGARWYNDSIATAPERAIAALKSFDEPVVLLAGGRDKNLPWEDFGRAVSQHVDHLIVFGEAAGVILRVIDRSQPRPRTIHRCQGLQQAVQTAAGLVEPGDVVLLSPGGTSFDEFRDFEVRGERFREWVNELL